MASLPRPEKEMREWKKTRDNERYCLIHDRMGHSTETCPWLRTAYRLDNPPNMVHANTKKVNFPAPGN